MQVCEANVTTDLWRAREHNAIITIYTFRWSAPLKQRGTEMCFAGRQHKPFSDDEKEIKITSIPWWKTTLSTDTHAHYSGKCFTFKPAKLRLRKVLIHSCVYTTRKNCFQLNVNWNVVCAKTITHLLFKISWGGVSYGLQYPGIISRFKSALHLVSERGRAECVCLTGAIWLRVGTDGIYVYVFRMC